MSLPWFPFRYQDFYVSTLHLTTMQRGAFIILLCYYWEHGSLPGVEDDIRGLAGVDPCDWPKTSLWLRGARSEVSSWRMFFADDWSNPTMDRLRVECQDRYDAVAKRKRSLCDRRPPAEEWDVIRRRIFARDDYTCRYCGERGGVLECDHIIPIARGGSNEDDNLNTACYPCNRSKGFKLLAEWRPSHVQ